MNRRERKSRKFSFMPIIFILMSLWGQAVFASNLGGYTGTTSRFTSDPLAAGTGGITLFSNSSTNSYAQNPASNAFTEKRSFDAGMVQLSLDRFIYSIATSTPLPPTAHLGVGVIAAGTKNIEARDSRGFQAGDMSDTELTYLVSFSNRFSERLAFGLSLKLLSRKFTSEDDDWLNLKATGFGAGLGIIYKPRDGSTIAFAVKDWNSSYKWKTQDLFERGSSYKDEFPVSVSWGILQDLGVFSLAFEHDHYFVGAEIVRGAVMLTGIRNLSLNTGLSYEDGTIFPGASARYELSIKEGPPMHIDLGMNMGVTGEGLRSYIGWGVKF